MYGRRSKEKMLPEHEPTAVGGSACWPVPVTKTIAKSSTHLLHQTQDNGEQ